jgi:hypothetical protein
MKPPKDIPEDVARLLEKREQEDRRTPKTPGAAKPPIERRKKSRRR